MALELERRNFVVRELRASKSDKGQVIEGYASVFNQLSDDLGGFREQVIPGAFADTIVTDDIRALFNHDANFVLGRNVSETLELEEDEHGLKIRITLPDTQWARDLFVSIQRGDVDQMSFGFRTITDNWHQEEGGLVRDLIKVRLFDVSPVTFPAYPQTVVNARDLLNAYNERTSQAADDSINGEAEEASRQARLDILRKKLDLAEF